MKIHKIKNKIICKIRTVKHKNNNSTNMDYNGNTNKINFHLCNQQNENISKLSMNTFKSSLQEQNRQLFVRMPIKLNF